MKSCDAIQTKIATSETLDAVEDAHLMTCEDCTSLQATARSLPARLGALSGEVGGEPAPAEIEAVRASVTARLRPQRPLHRLAWSAGPVFAGILSVALVLWVARPGTPDSPSDDAILAFLEEAEAVAGRGGDRRDRDEDPTPMLFLWTDDDPEDEPGLPLPGGFELLDEIL